MNDDSAQVAALIKELIMLNRAENCSRLRILTAAEIESRQSRRKRIRQELVQLLHLHNGRTSLI
jgi:hypothetical protein